MIRRAVTAAALTLLVAAPLCAQSKSDPDKKVDGGGLPAGWSARTDRPNSQYAAFSVMGDGLHVTSGSAAIYWKTAETVSGPFKASATFTQMKAPSHPEAYGIFFMGKNLQTPEQNYAYVLVRGDGKVMVKHRAGADVHTIMDWTENAAVHKQDAAGKATNTITVDASKSDSVRAYVNGTQVAAFAANHLGATDGVVGLRVNHNLDVHIADFSVKSTASAAAPKKAAKKAKAKS